MLARSFTSEESGAAPREYSRRGALRTIGLALAGAALVACGGEAPTGRGGETSTGRGSPAGQQGTKAGARTDFSARFAAYQPADEPDADPAKVVWPAFILQAGPEIQRLYEWHLTHGELTRYMPCFCNCGQDGHYNNRDCFIKAVNPDGSVVFDTMAPT